MPGMICPAICSFECLAWNLQQLRCPQGLRKINRKTSFWTSSLFNYWVASPSNCLENSAILIFHPEVFILKLDLLNLIDIPSSCPLRDTKKQNFAILPWESCALYRGVSIAEGGEISAIPWRCLDSQKGDSPWWNWNEATIWWWPFFE